MLKKLAPILAFVLVAAACGGSGDSGAEPAAPAVTPDPAAPAADQALGDAGEDDEAAHTDEAPHEDEAAHTDEAPHENEAAHSDDPDHATSIDPGDADRVVDVVMTEFAFTPSAVTVAAGETVTFQVSNQGALEHEFRLTTEHAAEEHVASGHEGHDDGGGGPARDEIVLLVPPGETSSVDVAFHEAGEFEIVACLIPGHFEAGMQATLEYEAA